MLIWSTPASRARLILSGEAEAKTNKSFLLLFFKKEAPLL
jgi:hypothetical protein